MTFNNQRYDLLIYGATPAEIACAIRASRENIKVVLINFFLHIGEMLTNGIGVWDTLYERERSPIYNGLSQSILFLYSLIKSQRF
jgi:predicted flavoprotein YhiN